MHPSVTGVPATRLREHGNRTLHIILPPQSGSLRLVSAAAFVLQVMAHGQQLLGRNDWHVTARDGTAKAEDAGYLFTRAEASFHAHHCCVLGCMVLPSSASPYAQIQ